MKQMKQNIALFITALIFTGMALQFSGCVKDDFDTPPINDLPVGDAVTISNLREMFEDKGTYKFTGDSSLYAVVTMDESTGNIYRSAYVKDGTDAVNLHFQASSALKIGDSIRVYLKNCYLNEYSGLLQIDSLHADSNIVILENNIEVEPQLTTIEEINNNLGDYESQLVKLKNVQFRNSELGKTYSEPDQSTNRILTGCEGNKLIVRTSSFSSFADNVLPDSNGAITGILGRYNDDPQLYIRTLDEVNFNQARCLVDTIPDGEEVTIQQLRDMHSKNGDMQISDTLLLFATVTMDEGNGNIYQSAYVQDETGAINVHMTESGTIQVGEEILIQLEGLDLSTYSDLLQIDGVDPIENILVLGSGEEIDPVLVSIPDLNSNFDYEAQLIRLENVQFVESDLGKTYSEDDQSTNRTITDCDGNTIIVRTSSYADFAGEQLPDGKGPMIAIMGRYFDTPQLYVRTPNEVELDGTRCDPNGGGGGTVDPVDEVNEAFNSVTAYEDVDLAGWTNVVVAGDRKWQGKEFSGNKYAQATGYNSGLSEMVTWLITPPVINTAGDKILNFNSAMAFWEHQDNTGLTVWASTDFTGDNFETANWTAIDATVVGENDPEHEWIPSGDFSLADFTGNVAIAFKYRGSDNESTSFRIDDVLINEEGGGGGGNAGLFEDLASDLGVFTGYSIIGENKEWHWEFYDDGSAYMSGYDEESQNENEDWLISPALDLSENSGTVLTILQAINYLNDQWDQIAVLISADYDGSSDPSQNGTWEELTVPNMPSGNNWDFVDSGDIDISSYDGSANVYIAFKYLSSSSNASTWEISEVEVK